METDFNKNRVPDLSGPLLAVITPDSETQHRLDQALTGLHRVTSGRRNLLPNDEGMRLELVRRLGPDISRGLFKNAKVVSFAPGEATGELTDQHLVDAVTLPHWIARTEDSWVLGLIEARKLRTLFMAVVDIRVDRIIGYEALTRGIGAAGEEIGADRLFETARREMLHAILDRAAVERALETAAQSDLPGFLFLNIDPASLLENAIDGLTLQKICRDFNIPPTRIVLELTHASETPDPGALAAVLKPFQEFGIRISLDDLGAGLVTFDLLVTTHPDFAKLDPQFVRRVHEDPIRRQILSALNSLCAQAKVSCIAEGVATSPELLAVKQAGVSYAEGWFFGRPVTWDTRSSGSLEETLSFRRSKP